MATPAVCETRMHTPAHASTAYLPYVALECIKVPGGGRPVAGLPMESYRVQTGQACSCKSLHQIHKALVGDAACTPLPLPLCPCDFFQAGAEPWWPFYHWARPLFGCIIAYAA